MPDTYQCHYCGKDDIAGLNGLKGHIKFSGGEHGERMSMPDDWQQNYSKVGGEPVEDDEDEQQAARDDADDEPEPEPDSEPEPTSGLSERFRKALTEDVTHLWK